MATTLSTTIYEYADQGSDSGYIIASSSAEKVGFYGKAPVAQRAFASALHISSNLATSASFGATQLAVVNEIQATLVGLGVWASA